MKLVLASHNKHKAEEIKEILGEGFSVITQDEAGFSEEVEENGKTFEENAILKAETVMRAVGLPTIADDSGLCVSALHGAPGIYTARFAGENASDSENIEKLLISLADVPEEMRGAEFVCTIAYARPNEETQTFTGKCEGRILFEVAGEGGFGYDPVFYTPVFKKSLAQISAEEKNSISHRGNALKLFKESLA